MDIVVPRREEGQMKGWLWDVEEVKAILTFILTIMLRCPCEYCSITSRTS